MSRKNICPRDVDGEVRLLHRGNYKHPEPVVDDAERYVANGKSVMILTTCSYMLEPVKAVLRKRGLPFHNPYRRKRTDWNPLRPPDADHPLGVRADQSLTAAQRLLAFLRPHVTVAGEPWTAEDLTAWMTWLKTQGILSAVGADALSKGSRAFDPDPANLRQLLAPAAFDRLTAAMGQIAVSDALAWWM